MQRAVDQLRYTFIIHLVRILRRDGVEGAVTSVAFPGLFRVIVTIVFAQGCIRTAQSVLLIFNGLVLSILSSVLQTIVITFGFSYTTYGPRFLAGGTGSLGDVVFLRDAFFGALGAGRLIVPKKFLVVDVVEDVDDGFGVGVVSELELAGVVDGAVGVGRGFFPFEDHGGLVGAGAREPALELESDDVVEVLLVGDVDDVHGGVRAEAAVGVGSRVEAPVGEGGVVAGVAATTWACPPARLPAIVGRHQVAVGIA